MKGCTIPKDCRYCKLLCSEKLLKPEERVKEKLLAIEELLNFSEELRDKYNLTETERAEIFGLARNELEFSAARENRKRTHEERTARRV